MLSLSLVACFYENRPIFQNLGLSILPGSVLVVKGSNGMGKTSLLKIIANIQKPKKGLITLGGTDIAELKKPFCTYIGHKLAIKDELSVMEHLVFWSKFYDSEQLVPAALHFFDLSKYINNKCHHLSAGYKQRLALSRLIACDSNLWLLDEPSNHLDSQGKDMLFNCIAAKIQNGGIVILTSHDNIPVPHNILNIEDYT